MTEFTKEQIDGLRELAENLTGKKLGNIKDPKRLQAMIDIARADEAEKDTVKEPTGLTKAQKAEQARLEAHKLIRVRVTPMAPFNKQLPGQLITAGNSVAGNVTRYVQFNEEWHVEQILLNVMQQKKYRSKVEKIDPQTRRKVYENRFYPQYGIEILPQLTPEELAQLAADQSARHAID